MERVNVVILAEETQYKVKVKNKIIGDDISIVGYADFKEESKLKIEGYCPDIIICAVNNSDVDKELIDFIKSVSYQNTGTAIIMVTDNVTVNIVNSAAKIGVRQVYDFSITPEDFSDQIREVNALEEQFKTRLNIEKRVRSKVIGFYGVKGGVGATTLVANAAVGLANKGKKVLVLDFDLQYGDANLFLDIEPKDTIVELARDPEGINIERVNATVNMHPTGFSILCAPKMPEYADYVTTDHIKKIIENVRPYFEYILIDMGTNFSDTSLTALENCDEIHLITNLDVPCLKGAKASMNVLDTLRVAEKVKLIINKSRTSLIKPREFENLLQRKCYCSIISDRNICDNAMNSGIPAVTGSGRSGVAKDFKKYVDLLIKDKDNL
jgi:pilus assembly protein CpaE